MIVHILSLNDDDDDAKALPTGVLKDDAMKKGGWGGQNVSKSDGVILVCSLTTHGFRKILYCAQKIFTQKLIWAIGDQFSPISHISHTGRARSGGISILKENSHFT